MTSLRGKDGGSSQREQNSEEPITDPWDERYIYLHENHTNETIHVGKYTSPMDFMGNDLPLSSVDRDPYDGLFLLLLLSLYLTV